MGFYGIIFYLFSAVAVASAVMVVISRNPLVSALYLALSFISGSALFVLLDAHFLALVQILVYAGAIVVLFIYVIMLLDLSPFSLKGTYGPFIKVVGGVLFAAVFAVMMLNVVDLKGISFGAAGNGYPQVNSLAQALFTEYPVPFELVSVVLMVGIVGAVMLVKKMEKEKKG